MFTQMIDTPVGVLQAQWTAGGLLKSSSFSEQAIGMGSGGLWSQLAGHKSSDLVEQRARQLEEGLLDYFVSGQIEWNLDWLDWASISPFHREVLEQCARIPSGQTLTYGELAARAGSPKAARAVGCAMARNRWPLIIPCHRVLGAGGRLTGYSGTGGIETKRRLLGLESGELSLALV